MKNLTNILLTLLAVLMLIGFGYLVTSPTLTEEASERHMNLESPFDTEEDESDDAYDFL